MSTTNGTASKETSNGEGARSRARVRPIIGLVPIVALARSTGKIAEEAQLRARMELARVFGDQKEERSCTRALAERLASRNVEVDTAIELARSALSRADDATFRHALAGWLEGLGEPGLAASELRKLVDPADPKTAAPLLLRIGVLHARAGDAAGALDTLAEAASLNESDALALELLGSVAGWSDEPPETAVGGSPAPLPDRAPARASAEAYVRAARRRADAGDPEGELEDLLRAFELDPSSSLASAALALVLTARDRPHAADEILRRHAAALVANGATADAATVHEQRRATSAARGDLAHALGAALDEGLDGTFSTPGADSIDDLFMRAGAFESLALRLQMRAESLSGRDAARRWAEIGRLLSGPLAAPERAVEAYARSVAADASDTDALHALKSLALRMGATDWVTEALVRGALGEDAYGASPEPSSRQAALRALVSHADENGDATLAAWAQTELAHLDPTDERARELATRVSDVVSRRLDEIAAIQRRMEISEPGSRNELLLEACRAMRSVPSASRDLAKTLTELSRTHITDDGAFLEALRVCERALVFDVASRLCRERMSVGTPAPRVHIAIVTMLRRAGQISVASDVARSLFDACTPWAYAVAWITAAAAGDRATRARAIAAAAPLCGPAFVSVLASIAAEELSAIGDHAAARKTAEQAVRANSSDPRALCVLASLVSASEGRVAATALEHAIASAGPSSEMCARLAQTWEQLEESDQALALTRRLVALRPGDQDVVDVLVNRVSRVGSAEAIADVVAWLAPQPQPSRATADRIAPALEALGTRDPARAVAVSHRVLDVLGPRHARLRTAIDAVAEATDNHALHAKLRERWLAAGASASERGPLLLALAKDYAACRDVDHELSAYVRAARIGTDLIPVRERLAALSDVEMSPDAKIAWLQARAELANDEGCKGDAATAFRELGGALWDMADDRPRAVQSWLRAAQLDPKRGYATLRRDLSTFADEQYAADCLMELVERESDRSRSGIIANEAARAALAVGAFPRALALARTALERHPGHAEALETAEKACGGIGRVQEMSPLYDQAARGSRGRFGRRAAHHRAARYFEAAGIPMLALKHAAQAFIAVPSEGTTLGLLSRTADRAQRRSVAVRTVEHVADLARNQGIRAAWLLHAVNLAARDLEGTRQRFDLLLKSAVLSPAPTTISMLAVAARELMSLAPDDADAIALRLERASDSLAKGLEGPDGARLALSFAEMALDLFNDATWAWRSLERANDADADVDEYAHLVKHAGHLARAENAAEALARVMASCEKPYANVGHALLRLLGSIAHGLGDSARRARALVGAAEKDQDDDMIVAEADEAVTAHGDQALIERFSKKVGVFRRSEALRAIATKLSEAGEHAAAVIKLERANEIAPNELKAAIATELGQELSRSGRGEEAILRELNAPGIAPVDRARRWADLAKIREDRGDLSGATDASLQAATDEPNADRWAAVERLAEASMREHIRVEALQNLVKYVDDDARLAVRKRLARVEGARGSLAAAEAVWREVWAADPADVEADVAIEALLVARASYDELADHLARRAERLSRDPAAKETRRAVRLRRAAILEQRLSRLDEAAEELENLLAESPGNASALRWLADLRERLGQPPKVIAVLDKLVEITEDVTERHAFELRRVRALVASGELERAKSTVRTLLTEAPTSASVLEARVEIARASHDAAELGKALSELARVSPEEARARSEMLVEAAQAAARTGDNETSLARAREAAQLAPDVASTQLFARGLEYRLRGKGTREDAEATVAALVPIASEPSLEPEDIALCGFLLAEAEDVVSPGKGEVVLRDCLTRVGPHALVALGLAERAAASGRHVEAFRFYVDAVFGNLLGLRRSGAVALAAADAAERAGDGAALSRFLEEAAKDAESQVAALQRLAQIAAATNDTGAQKTVLRKLAGLKEGAARADVLAQLARVLFDSTNPAERVEADRTLREAIVIAPEPQSSEFREELDAFRSRQPATMPPERRSSVRIAVPELPAPPPVLLASAPDDGVSSIRHAPLGAPGVPWGDEPRSEEAKAPPTDSAAAAAPSPGSTSSTSSTPSDARVVEARRMLAEGAVAEAERLLSEAVRDGSLEAADALEAIVAKDPTRSAALLKVRRQAVELEPGNMARLLALRDAAKADQNLNYARAIDHVIRAFDVGAGPLPPPPLGAQSAQPGILTLLTRHSREPAGEAFGVLWEGAPSLFSKTPQAYNMSGFDRVMPGPMSPLSRLYEVSLRLLEPPRSALFYSRAKEKDVPGLTVALLPTPSAILSGDAREDSPQLRWVLGAAIASSLPENTLPLGLPAAEASAVFDVLVSAFGPPGKTIAREHARLAETLWQTLAPRAQRRLKELLTDGEIPPFELVLERARQSGRRLGMFLTGDFGQAARAVVAEHPSFNVAELERPGGLARICSSLPALADLYRLALRPEYADARWAVPNPASSTRYSTGRIPLV
ncbi:Exonuclease SbcC [Labilithrix luteola]|uniref:Exonuclease SbcC n=1 Tax=Labilithrix luteola TaxID=1391654 RepID=A0A0K1QB10_9BACT|nr:tetratricopeptide repeat protein [Labilithrix luteola]AKV02976.1 Exonuclease SbcC [Labilithrix luteola]